MNEALRYRVNSELKNEYNEFIIEKYGHKQNRCGSEITKLMKFQLAMNGNEKYRDDPDVMDLMENVQKKFKHISSSKAKTDNSLEEMVERKLEEKLEEKLDTLTKKIENKVRRESSKKHGLAEFKKQFQMTFKDHHQVSRRELEQFIMNQSDIVDNRSIRNRIQYLKSHGMIQPFAPNVFDVNMSNLF